MRRLLHYEHFQICCGRRCVYLGLVWAGVCFHGAYGNGTTSFDSFLWKNCLATRQSWNNPNAWRNAESRLHLDCSRAWGRVPRQPWSPAACELSTNHPLLWVLEASAETTTTKKGAMISKRSLSWAGERISLFRLISGSALDEPLQRTSLKF